MDLVGPFSTMSLSGKLYVLIVVDDFLRFTWIMFLTHKDETYSSFTNCVVVFKMIKDLLSRTLEPIIIKKLKINHFSTSITPQQNGVVERKNKILKEMSRIMLCENSLPKYFWAEAVNTAYFIINSAMIRLILNKTPYKLWK